MKNTKNEMNTTQDCDKGDVPKEVFDAAEDISIGFFPKKSKQKYIETYTKFTVWKKGQITTSTREAVLLV